VTKLGGQTRTAFACATYLMAEEAPVPDLALVTHGAQVVDSHYLVYQHSQRQHSGSLMVVGEELERFLLIHVCDQEKKMRQLRTRIYQAAVVLGFVLGLLAVDLTQTLPPVRVATRHDVLDSSRLYKYWSALRRPAIAEGNRGCGRKGVLMPAKAHGELELSSQRVRVSVGGSKLELGRLR
jgi:hypothetical protein